LHFKKRRDRENKKKTWRTRDYFTENYFDIQKQACCATDKEYEDKKTEEQKEKIKTE